MSPLRPSGDGDRGQVIVLFALVLVALLAISGLAIDVARARSTFRDTRSTADAAALAGAQELQGSGRATVNPGQQQEARLTALLSLRDQLGQTADPGCGDGSANIVDCVFPSTGHLVSIKTPSPSCAACDPARSVQVSVRVPDFPTTFSRVVGQSSWDIGATSVAGLKFAATFGLIALRPPNPRPNGLDSNQQNIDVNGTGTRLFVSSGDVASNTSVFTNAGGYIDLEPGYLIYHYDAITPDPWNKDLSGEPGGKRLSALLPDPNYPVPVEPATVFATQADGLVNCAGIVPAGLTVVPTQCYGPGTYASDFAVRQNTEIAYLTPGVYSFRGNISVSGTLIGGRDSSLPGIVLRLRQDRTFAGNNAALISINEGSVGCADDSCRPAAVVDEAGTRIETAGRVPLSIVVPRDPACFSGMTPVLCSDNSNDTISLPGNGDLAISGVVYAPSDYVRVIGDNSASSGKVGQLIAWRITYSGGATLNQQVATMTRPGVIRLDPACSAPAEPCNP